MRHLLILSVLLTASATSTRAQVTLDLHALQALPANGPATPAPRVTASITPRARPPAATASPAPAATASAAPAATASAAPAANAPAAAPAPPAPAPALPREAPESASIAPVEPPPPAAAPAPPPVSDTAKTAAAPTPEGLRLSFAPGQSDLSPESAASLKQLAAAAPQSDATTFNIQAYAQGAADDPSTARRMSLARAMAVRSALVADGVASAHIFVRALGSQAGSGPPDRVDIDVTGGNDQAAAPR